MVPLSSFQRFLQQQTRRHFFGHCGNAAAIAALAQLGWPSRTRATESPASGSDGGPPTAVSGGLPGIPHFPPRARNVIYLHMVGGPSQMDLFDYKPHMDRWYDQDLPESVRDGQRLTTMTSGQSRFPIAPSRYKFAQHGQSGMWFSEMLPWTARCADQLCMIRSVHTEAINHEPAITYIQTGNMVTGRPCLGAWASYGLGSLNDNLPTFVVMVAQPSNTEQIQAISARLWQAGYLPGQHAGVSLRSSGDPILYLNNPPGLPDHLRRQALDTLRSLNQQNFQQFSDPETETRIEQYELAFRMQASVPELTDLSDEPEHTFALYGGDAAKPGTFANTALMARRMVERGVRFVQIYHNNWDHHGNLTGRMPDQCRDVDQACYGLINDLQQRGLLDSTLILWGGEFGRTIYSQGQLSRENYGRDHHPRCFSMWMAGGGTAPGVTYGETDDFSYNITRDPVHIRDLHATILRLLGIDHQRFTYNFQGLDQRLTGVEPAEPIADLMA
jgi:hypothetical protein